jgi:hypothetical protein
MISVSWIRQGGKFRFFWKVLLGRLFGTDRSCPYCSTRNSILRERKYAILDLRQCLKCGLMFRWPKILRSRTRDSTRPLIVKA